MTVGQRIKLRRGTLGFSQVYLADQVNITKQTLYKYENDIITNIPSDKIERIANALNVTPAFLMGWDDAQIQAEPPPETNYTLTEKEAEILAKYRALDDIGKAVVEERMDTLLEKNESGNEREMEVS